MPVIIFHIYHGLGHFNACLRLAKVLRSQYEIVFAGFIFFQKQVEAQGFRFYPLKTVPFGLGFEEWVNTIEKRKYIYLNSLMDRWNDRLYKSREADIQQMLDLIKPDYVLIDSWQSTDFIVMYPQLKVRGIKTAIIHTMLSNKLTADLPPLNSLALPEKKIRVKLSQLTFRLRAFGKTAIQWIKYVGKTNHAIIRKQITRNDIPEKYIYAMPALFSPGLDQLHELILTPREFEFPTSHKADLQHYLGFMIDHQRVEHRDQSFDEIFTVIRKKIATGSRLVYCSFGTVELKHQKKLKRFLRKLIMVARASTDTFLIAGNAYSMLKDFNLPDNVFAVSVAPQLQVLAHASLFITHGGLNSVKEAIYAGVPLLVYPIDHRTDNKGISSRVLWHKLGLRGDLTGDSANDIQKKIATLLGAPAFRNNLQIMKMINETYAEEKIFEVIKNINHLE